MPNPLTILLVEDDEDVRETMAQVLERAGHRVRLAINGRDALSALDRDGLPDLMLLDLMMPVMNGWEFLDATSGRADLARLPKIVLSAGDDAPPGVWVLRKPISLDGLLESIGKAAGAPSHGGADRLEATAAFHDG
jgi:CheY-like chemotaxis protein